MYPPLSIYRVIQKGWCKSKADLFPNERTYPNCHDMKRQKNLLRFTCTSQMFNVGADSGATCVYKMAASKREKAFCVMEFARTGAVVTVPQHFQTKFGNRGPRRRNCIARWVKQFE